MGHIFIAHVEEDADVALGIALGLEKAGYLTWTYEVDSVVGSSYILRTGEAVAQSQAVIVIISPDSLGSNQVTKEVVRAHESGKHFIPILKNITHIEFQNRQPEWREAIGSATSISVPKAGVADIIPSIITGVALLGIKPETKTDSVRMARIENAIDELKGQPPTHHIPHDLETKKTKSKKPLLISLSILLILAVMVSVLMLNRGKNNKKIDQIVTTTTTSSGEMTSAATTSAKTTIGTQTTTKQNSTTALNAEPDLAILNISNSPSNPSDGQPTTFTVAVVNQGKAGADSFFVYFYVDGTYQDEVQIDSLSAGATITKTFNWTASLGTHTINFAVDPTNLIDESNETNNSKDLVLPITLQPDLIIQSIKCSSIPAIGTNINVIVTVQNRGNGKSIPCNLGCSYYQYINKAYNPNGNPDVQGILTPIPSIPAGGTVSLNIYFPYGGNPLFQAVADYNDVVPESDETNNSMIVTLSVGP